ncbi:MAG: 2-dehydropantoate 2-reductase, partial [Acidobacteria bacterium]|nr:2-dehydropantoate 2-reductase [Acidobacteriota bacterium]
MGGALGAKLSKGGNDVTLVDVSRESVETIHKRGLTVEDQAGRLETIAIRASTDPASVRDADLAMVVVKCYHTQAAVESIVPYLNANATVLSLQNGWGNAPRIAAVVGEERVMAGVTYHSATVLGPGHVKHSGRGMTWIGEMDGRMSPRLERVAT